MRKIFPLLVFVALIATALPAAAEKASPPEVRLLLTGSRVTDTFIPQGSSDLLESGALASYSLIVENDGLAARSVAATVALPTGFQFVPGSLRVNGLPAELPAQVTNEQITWPSLELPAARDADPSNLAGLHVFFSREPSLEEIDRRLEWAAQLVGRGGTIKLFLPGIAEYTAEPPYWMIHAVRQVYTLGLRPVVRLGFANGDTSSFTRKWDDGVGQMRRADGEAGYWGIGWAMRTIVAQLLANTAAAAAAAPSPELTVIVGNEPNLEWVERDWFVDYEYVRQPDGSFDSNWLTTDPADPFAAANSRDGWKKFVRGIPGPTGAQPTYETRLDDYVRYLGYDAAAEYARFLHTTSGLLKELQSPRLLVAAGAVASGGGDLEGRYAYHQRHFIRRMLRTMPNALEHVDVWTTNNYPYTLDPSNNYHNNPANFDLHPLGEPYWHTEIGIDSYRGDLDYLAYLQRQGLAGKVPTRAIIGEVGYGIGEGWGTDFGGPPLTEDLRARYMADIFERYYNGWRDELAQVNLWQLGDPERQRPTFHMFDKVYPDSESLAGWPTHRHLVFDALAARASRPGAGRLILTFQARIAPDAEPGLVTALAELPALELDAVYRMTVSAPSIP